MILDRIEQIERYKILNPHFSAAFAFLQQAELSELPCGKHDIDGDNVFAIVDKATARPREQARLEAHRKYIDIQVVLSGSDEMGWKNRAICKIPDGEYDSDSDVEFFADAPDAWIPVSAGSFAIFFPDDTHAPLIGSGELHKVVVKVMIN